MWPESSESKRVLRTGLTTGCCATACALAAGWLLLGENYFNGAVETEVTVKLPKGKLVSLKVHGLLKEGGRACASTFKDAGDDPDVTHGARIFTEVALVDKAGVQFVAGEGVGTVTKTGLILDVGEPAINPVPRAMIIDHLNDIAEASGYTGGFRVTVGIENGRVIAQKTMNPRLGIKGGLSVLGTTGIVRPFSCAAYIASIHQGIDVALANGLTRIAATTGNSSEIAIQNKYGLDTMAMIEMGDFIGAVLKYLKNIEKEGRALQKLIICGGFGKLTKFADGHLDLHSRASSINFEFLKELALERSRADNQNETHESHANRSLDHQALSERILTANTSIEVLTYCHSQGIDLGHLVCEKAIQVARKIIPRKTGLEIYAINRQGNIVGSAASEALN